MDHSFRKITTIIFSKNRAMQLDGVLRSLRLHCQDMDQLDISVLYHATDERHLGQYQSLAFEYANQVNFKRQENFRRDLFSFLHPYETGGSSEQKFLYLSKIGGAGFSQGSFMDRVWRRTLWWIQKVLIDQHIPHIPANRFVLFLVDDNIFVRDFRIVDAVNILMQQSKALGFSLRLGENTSYFYSQNRAQVVPQFTPLSDEIVIYDWSASDGDFGYPLEVSSSIYRLRDILPFLAGLRFENPNVLEDRMAFHVDVFRSKYPLLACFRNSVTFCNPINMVQTIMPNRAGSSLQFMPDELAARFERGERVRVDSYSDFMPSACHQEVELIFEKRMD